MEKRTQKAYQLFNKHDFEGALRLYKHLKNEHKTQSFDANIFLCEKKIKEKHGLLSAHHQNMPLQRMDKPEKRSKQPPEKTNVGIILSSSLNLKYLDKKHLHNTTPFKLNLFYIHDNGLQPLHDLSLLGENYYRRLDNGILKHNTISVDILLAAHPNTILTTELIQEAVDSILSSSELTPLEFDNLEIDASSIVESRVSVILPTYKRPDQLEKAIRSVISQDYHDIELIVVDDNGSGSEFSAATKEIIDRIKIEAKDSSAQIKYIQHKYNANGAAARNTGILHSTGGYICFLDDDDIYLPGRISKSVAALKFTADDIGCCYCGFLGWNSTSRDESRFVPGDLTKELLTLDYGQHYLHTNTATYKRSAVFWINGFNISYRRHQDLEFNIRFFQSYKASVVMECLVQINPEKPVVDNKLYGINIINLKSKFLGDFESVINGFDDETRMRIYKNNWEEAIYYAGDTDKLLIKLKNDLSNGALQIFKIIEERKNSLHHI